MSRIATLLVLVAVAACSAQSTSGPKGSVRINARASPELASADGAAPLVCGTFTLQPYSLDINGNQTLAGSPITITSVAAAQTDTIAGCIAGPTDGAGDNWGYIVTASQFVDCSGGAADGQAIMGLSPSSVTGNYPVDCAEGVDTPLAITVNVSIPEANNAGYVDISVGVNSSEVQVGCKLADFDGTTLHFGSSWEGNTSAGAPDGIWGLAPIANGTQQSSGQVNAGGVIDQYYTGQLSMPAPSAATIVQTFMPSCAGTFIATGQPECITSASSPASQDGTTPVPSATTSAVIADAFIADPTDGWASASILADGTDVQINSAQTLTPIPAGSTPSSNDPGLADLSSSQTFNDPSIAQFTGIWPAEDGFGFVFTFLDGSGNASWGHILFDSSAQQWTLGPVYPLASFSPALATCLGLFTQGLQTCQPKPNDCSELLLTIYPPKRAVEVRPLIKYESAVPFDTTQISTEITGTLYLPDINGNLAFASEIQFAPRQGERHAKAASAPSVAGAIDCSAAIAGNTQGYVALSVSSLTLPTAAGSPTLLGKLASKVVPYDCANPTDLSSELSVPLIGVDSSNNILTATTEATGATNSQYIEPVTCGIDPNNPASTVARISTISGFSGSTPSVQPSGYLMNSCWTGTHYGQGEEVNCNMMEPIEAWVDSARSSVPNPFGASETVAVGQGLTMLVTTIAASSSESLSSSAVRYAVPTSVTELPAALDATCMGITTQASTLDALVTGLDMQGNRFGYSLLFDNTAKTGTIGFVAGMTQSTQAGLYGNNVNSRVFSFPRETVLDTCVDPGDPGTVYLTTQLQQGEPTDPSAGLIAITVDLSDENDLLVNTGAGGDPIARAAAFACQTNRENGSANREILSLGNTSGQIAASPNPGNGQSVSCASQGLGMSCDCFLPNGTTAFGRTEAGPFTPVCQLNATY